MIQSFWIDGPLPGLNFLVDYTYLYAEPPELRAQNERCHRLAKQALEGR